MNLNLVEATGLVRWRQTLLKENCTTRAASARGLRHRRRGTKSSQVSTRSL